MTVPANLDIEKAVRLDETDPVAGVAAEHAYLSGQLGQADVDWALQAQRLVRSGGRAFDVLSVEVRGQSHEIIFDITSFYGRPDDEATVAITKRSRSGPMNPICTRCFRQST